MLDVTKEKNLDAKIPHFQALFVHITEVEANFTAGTAQVKVAWFPPIFQEEEEVNFATTLSSLSDEIPNQLTPVIQEVSISFGSFLN